MGQLFSAMVKEEVQRMFDAHKSECERCRKAVNPTEYCAPGYAFALAMVRVEVAAAKGELH